MTDIRPFRYDVPDTALEDLRTRLANTRWPEREVVDDWTQGIPLAYMQDVCAYWRDGYDWRRCEATLNGYPHHVTDIDGLDITFMHVRSPHADALPLVMTHGWPGSIVEFLKVVEPLTEPEKHGGTAADAFHLVCPTLPGFGFSAKPERAGWDVERIGRAWGQLMARLGYERWVAQGGDWGAAVTTSIALTETDHCIAMHTNMPIVSPSPAAMENLTDYEKDAVAGSRYYWDWDAGYSTQQSTRPQTLGYGLVDSPVAQCAWILEKFWAWTDCDGHPENVLSRDELLDNVMMYWLPAAGASSARLYWESFNKALKGDKPPVEMPAGASVFPKEIFRSSRRWVEERFRNLVHYNQPDKGGHFAAMEQPLTLVNEVRATFAHVRG